MKLNEKKPVTVVTQTKELQQLYHFSIVLQF